MDLLQLRYFRAVARKEHISRAAEELRVAQPSLSRTIARLEDELGVPLFDRKGRRIVLNRYGAAFLDRVDRALRELDDGRRELAELAGFDAGDVAIASETLLSLTALLTGFVKAHPGVRVGLRQAAPAEMSRWLREGVVHVCMASQPLTGPGLETATLVDEEVLLAVPRGHRLAGREHVGMAELVAEPFVTTRPGLWPRELLDRLFAGIGHRPVIACEADEPGAIQDLISAGLGVGLNPAMAREAATQAPVAWLRVDDPACRRRLTLAWRGDAQQPLAARLFRAHALANMAGQISTRPPLRQ